MTVRTLNVLHFDIRALHLGTQQPRSSVALWVPMFPPCSSKKSDGSPMSQTCVWGDHGITNRVGGRTEIPRLSRASNSSKKLGADRGRSGSPRALDADQLHKMERLEKGAHMCGGAGNYRWTPPTCPLPPNARIGPRATRRRHHQTPFSSRGPSDGGQDNCGQSDGIPIKLGRDSTDPQESRPCRIGAVPKYAAAPS